MKKWATYSQDILQARVINDLRPVIEVRNMVATVVGVGCLHRVDEPHEDVAELLRDICTGLDVNQLLWKFAVDGVDILYVPEENVDLLGREVILCPSCRYALLSLLMLSLLNGWERTDIVWNGNKIKPETEENSNNEKKKKKCGLGLIRLKKGKTRSAKLKTIFDFELCSVLQWSYLKKDLEVRDILLLGVNKVVQRVRRLGLIREWLLKRRALQLLEK